MRDPEVFIAITDCELIETMVYPTGARMISILTIGEAMLPMEVLAWINLLRRDDGEAMGSR